jgi:hypothetical protein
LDQGDRFDLVVEPDFGGICVATDDADLVEAVRHPGAPRAVFVIPLAEKLVLIRDAFRRFATAAKRPTERKVGRPARRRVDIRSAREG